MSTRRNREAAQNLRLWRGLLTRRQYDATVEHIHGLPRISPQPPEKKKRGIWKRLLFWTCM